MSIRAASPCAALVALVAATSAAADVFPDSSERLLAPGEVQALPCEALWLARNEIYARNGYIFKTARGRAVFGTGGYTDSPSLNAPEAAKVALIQGAERRAGCR